VYGVWLKDFCGAFCFSVNGEKIEDEIRRLSGEEHSRVYFKNLHKAAYLHGALNFLKISRQPSLFFLK